MAINFVARKYTEGQVSKSVLFSCPICFRHGRFPRAAESSHFGSRHLSAHARNDA